MKTLVIIPAYNEELNIKNVVEDVKSIKNVDYIVVNDGSKDKTLDILKENNYNYINCFQNLGLFGAVQLGFKYALIKGYDIAIQFDADSQHIATYIPDLVKEIENGSDIAIGSRFIKDKKPFSLRMLGSRMISLAIFLTTFKRIKDPTSGMRAYNKDTFEYYVKDINNPPEPDTLTYMIFKGKKVKEVPVKMNERKFGETVFNFSSSIKYMVRMLVSIFFIQPFRKRKDN